MIRSSLFALLLAAAMASSAMTFAQSEDGLAPPPVYKGEIRRGADGRLIAVPTKSPEVAAASSSSRPATMVVGSGEKITTIAEAARQARDGEVIEIRPGDYRGQPVAWTQDNLLIRGSGTRPVLLADGRITEGKAIWVVRGGRVRIENIEFRGARAADGKGAGLRFERGDLLVQRCAFIDNENGIVTADRPEMMLTVSDSEFSAPPRDAGAPHHLLSVGAIGRFVLSGSRFEQGFRGDLVLSRARENDVRYNLLVDGAGGRAAYELEFPNGGVAYVIGNVIGQSATTDNPVLVAYGAEGPRWSDNALYFAHNTLLNDASSGAYLKVWAHRFVGGVEVWAINNLSSGHGELSAPAQGRFEGNQSVARRDLLDYGGLPLRLSSFSPLRGSVRLPGHARGVDLFPAEEFRFPLGSRPAHPGNAPSPGAFQ